VKRKKRFYLPKAYLGIQGRIMAISTFSTLSVLVLDLERRKTVMKMEYSTRMTLVQTLLVYLNSMVAQTLMEMVSKMQRILVLKKQV
jgi:fluoride ion exporter CrcB/FEX